MKNKVDLLISLSSEIDDLNLKVDRLNSFIHSEDFFKLDCLDRDYLFLQRHSMLMYLHVLAMRKEKVLDE